MDRLTTSIHVDASEGVVPDYAVALAAYHRAFARELKAIVEGLPLAQGSRVLDVACGDGTYGRWLAERVGPCGSVVGFDLSPGYMEWAHETTSNGAPISLVTARLERLPFPDDTFDLAWCAQSLFSLPDPVDALRRIARVVRPGGVVAVLEDDTLHQLLLPWPVEVELALRGAELVAFAEQSDRPRKFYVGRRLVQVFRAASLEGIHRRTSASDRQAPLDRPLRAFLADYLADLHQRAAPHLEPEVVGEVEAILDPRSEVYLLNWPDLALTVIDHVVWGFKPEPNG
jgi:SAM-dependent methyltransferase